MILLILAAETGFSPIALFLNRASWLPWIALPPALVGLGYALKVRTVPPRALTLQETIGAYYAIVFDYASACLFLFLMYGALYSTAEPLATVARWTHLEGRWTANLEWWVLLGFGVMLLFGISGNAALLLTPKLFPTAGIGNPLLFPGITARRR